VIDEVSDDDSDQANIEMDSIEGDSLTMLNEYNKQDPLPPNVDKDEFSLYLKKLHDASVLDGD